MVTQGRGLENWTIKMTVVVGDYPDDASLNAHVIDLGAGNDDPYYILSLFRVEDDYADAGYVIMTDRKIDDRWHMVPVAWCGSLDELIAWWDRHRLAFNVE